MYFPLGEEYSGVFEVEGFKFRKHVTRKEGYIFIEITDMTYKTVAEMKVYDISDVDIAQEDINVAIYDYVIHQTDDLDKIMSYFIKN